jgi:hypothetical protein
LARSTSSTRSITRPVATFAAASALAFAAAVPAQASTSQPADHDKHTQHVLLISVDGLHESDLTWYVAQHPQSALAALSRAGDRFTNADTPFPSDSFPGMVGQVTGGDPKTTGVYYDVTYNHALLPPGTTDCTHTAPGTMVAYDESADDNPDSIDAGQGLSGLPGSILSMTGQPQSLLNPAALPVDPATCLPLYPHQYLKVNTIFEVAKAHGLRTAWSDKHPAYEILSGPSGTGIDDLFTPEINSQADTSGDDWTQVNSLTRQYDDDKVQAVLNEIDGSDHSGADHVGVPAIFGLNFQSVSTAEKLPTSDGQTGGYEAGGTTPGPLLSGSLDFVNNELGRFVFELSKQHLLSDTDIILSAKHGQSPTDGSALTRIDDGPIIDAINGAWTSAHPGAGDLIVGASDDDGMLLWLSDRSASATRFVKKALLAYSGNGTGTDGHAKATDIEGNPKAYAGAGLAKVYAGAGAAKLIGVPTDDSRVPDVIGIARHGTVYTGGTSKIAEHGGDDPQDRNVPLVVWGRGITSDTHSSPVGTTQIAPTILTLLGLDPEALQAVQIQGTPTLPLH